MQPSVQPVEPEPANQDSHVLAQRDNALERTGELYARSELERRLERIDQMIEKAKKTS